jgi:hypothetical protein
MIEIAEPITIFLIGNSLLTITLILNQNESVRDNASTQNATSNSNPLEKFTWVCFLFQLFLLLIKTKLTDF